MTEDEIPDVSDWSDFVGQQAMKDRLQVHISAARARIKPLEHVLLVGSPGFGKTTLAKIIANALDDDFESVNMPLKEGVLAQIVRRHAGVLLLDELHLATAKMQESLLTLLQEGYVQTSSGRKIETRWLTVIAATTRGDKIPPSVAERFPIRPFFTDYSEDEMTRIVIGMGRRAGVEISPEHAAIYGGASNGVPRQARQFVVAHRDLKAISEDPDADQVLDLCGVDRNGLSQFHHRYLDALDTLGGRAGIDSLCNVLQMHSEEVKNLERVLLKRGIIEATRSGRELIGFGAAKPRRKS